MNKFLKTKDNKIYIFKISERYSLHSSKMVDRYQELGADHTCAYGYNILKKENISKESNTIEELCDEFVLKATIDGQSEYQNGKRLHLLKISKIVYEHDRRYLCEIYGAIWTEFGLKYICKLSDGGMLVPFTK